MGTYFGQPTGEIRNNYFSVEYLLNFGPRIVRLQPIDTTINLLAETPTQGWVTPYGYYNLWGGHRFWIAPETHPFTSLPENQVVTITTQGNELHLTQKIHPEYPIQKTMSILLNPDAPFVMLTHTLENLGDQPLQVSAWGITQLPPGGWAIMPQSSPPMDHAAYHPNRSFVLWPYAHWNDPRLHLFDDYIIIQGASYKALLKAGHINRSGWSGYLWNGFFFRKWYDVPQNEAYPDLGCNSEVYVNNQYLELESLGPLSTLEPGETTSHTELWEISQGWPVPKTAGEVREIALSIDNLYLEKSVNNQVMLS